MSYMYDVDDIVRIKFNIPIEKKNAYLILSRKIINSVPHYELRNLNTQQKLGYIDEESITEVCDRLPKGQLSEILYL